MTNKINGLVRVDILFQLTCEYWHFLQHGRDEVDALDEVGVDVHVVGDLEGFVSLLFLRSPLVAQLHLEALGKEFTNTARTRQIGQGGVRLADVTRTEGTQAHLHHCAIVENLPKQQSQKAVTQQYGEKRFISPK